MRACVRAWNCVYVRACVRACVRAWVCVHTHALVCVRARMCARTCVCVGVCVQHLTTADALKVIGHFREYLRAHARLPHVA